MPVKEDKVSPKVSEGLGGVIQKGGDPPRVTIKDFKYTQARPELIEQSGLTEQEITKYRNMAMRGMEARAESTGNMGVLQNVDRLPTDIKLAKENTLAFLSKKRNPTKKEVGIWEALRDPNSGVPPRDVRVTGNQVMIDN